MSMNGSGPIVSVSQCAMLGMDEHGYGFFQVVVTARRS
jgi:hypothetical protein